MKICYICNEYPPSPHGGIGTFTQVLARSLVQEGHEVRVVGVYPHTNQSLEYEVDQGVRIWRLRAPKNRFGWPVARFQLWSCVSKWAREGSIDLIEAPDWEGWTAGWPQLPAPIVVRLHGSVSYFQTELEKPIKTSMLLLERSALRRADAWCSVSRYTAEKTKKLFGLRNGPDAILYNPIEVMALNVSPRRSSNRVIFTGTLTFKKGIVSLIQAWPDVRHACPSAELHIFGKDGRAESGGSMKEFLSTLLNGDSSCRFHGHVSRDSLFEALETASVAVFPSYAEAFAVAPLEAMTKGCPTIYSQRGSGPELIEDGVDGLLIDPDRPLEIAEAIIRVLKNIDLASQISQAGLEKVRTQFSIVKLTQQNAHFYRSCIEHFHAKAA